MNREIKFRAWNDHKKEWYAPELIKVSLDFSMIGLCCGPDHGYIFEDTTSWKVIIQQYTGLKDKNGKEIYEGDILKLNELNFEVMYVDGQYIATCPYYNKYHWPKFEHFAREARCSEVVGNVFENRELLKR